MAALSVVLLSLVTLSVAGAHLATAGGSGPGRGESVRLLPAQAAAPTLIQFSARGRHAFLARFAVPNPGWNPFPGPGAASALPCDIPVPPHAGSMRLQSGRSPPVPVTFA
ncbi:MAG TPA: hypothetical protein VHA11_09435 [Bryobacteraceae bacterium]|nr:hypothetical protein [Bryobacteraceae bacterium]